MEIYKNIDNLFLDGEIWKDIDGYCGDYQISNFGRVKSLKFRKEKILKQGKNGSGYLFVGLSKNGKEKGKRIHVLLFETFNNYKLKSDECVHHLNGIKLDNNLDNFQLMIQFDHKSFHMSGEKHPMYGVHRYGENAPNFGNKHSDRSKLKMSEKLKYKFKKGELNTKGINNPMYGVHKYGNDSPNHKLTEQDVVQIKLLLEEGILTQKEIAEIFEVDRKTISNIKTEKTWKHVRI